MKISEAVKHFQLYLTYSDKSEATIEGYTKDLRYFQQYLEKQDPPIHLLKQCTLQHIEDFLIYRKKSGLSAATRSRNLNTIRSFYKFCKKKKYIKFNITEELEPIKLPQKEREYLSPLEQEQLYNAIRHPLIKVVVFTLCHTGMRVSECTNLKVRDVDFKMRLIKVVEGKGKKDRYIPMNDKLYDVLSTYMNGDRRKVGLVSEYVFATKKTGKLSPTYINQILRESTKKLRWTKRVSAHILRHTFASTLLATGANIVDIQQLLGHTDIKTTALYVHINLQRLTTVVNQL